MKVENLISFKNVSFRYEKEDILQNINITIKSNDFIGLKGENGSGKSTFLKLALHELKPNVGSVIWSDQLAKKDVAYIEQNGGKFKNVFPGTVKELLSLYANDSIFQKNNKIAENKIDDVLCTVNMIDYKNHQLFALSGGQLQRILIARSLLQNAKIMLLDEPLNGLDQTAIAEYMKLLTQIYSKGICIIIILHDAKLLQEYCHQIYEFENYQMKEEA